MKTSKKRILAASTVAAAVFTIAVAPGASADEPTPPASVCMPLMATWFLFPPGELAALANPSDPVDYQEVCIWLLTYHS